jgi:ribose transport system substrate-binding protein
MNRLISAAFGCAFAIGAFAGGASAQETPRVVQGPGALPQCFAPAANNSRFFQWPQRPGPYRIALVNGFVGNTWRIQMIRTAKAFAEQADIAPHIREFRVVSTGTDVAAQIAAIDNFINSRFDAIITIAVNPTAFGPVIRRANRAGVVLVPFDNVVDSNEVLMVNEDQTEMGRMMARWLVNNIPSHSGRILEVRGLPGNSVDRDRHVGFREVMEAAGNRFEFVEVVGNWDDGTAQRVTADAIAVHREFAGVYTQGGSTGTVRAFIDANHRMIPVAGEAENGFRRLCAEREAQGLRCASAGQSPGLVAIAMKAAITALQGQILPQSIAVPIPYVEAGQFRAGVNFFPDLTDNFFTPNEFPPCGVNMTAREIMTRTEGNQ